MTDSERLNEEITFLTDEIRSLKVRIAANENAVKLHKIEMLERLRARCERALKIVEGRAVA